MMMINDDDDDNDPLLDRIEVTELSAKLDLTMRLV